MSRRKHASHDRQRLWQRGVALFGQGFLDELLEEG